jgi:hypothetical protein
MKKIFSIVLTATIIMLLAAILLPASPILAKEATELKLVDVRFSFSNGLVLTFAANGKISSYNLPSTVLINGEMVHVDCVVKNDERTVVCHTTKDLGFEQGDSGYVTVFGQTMNFSAPKVLKNKPATENSTETCPAGTYPLYHILFIFIHNPDTLFSTYVLIDGSPFSSLDSFIEFFKQLNADANDPIEIQSIENAGCEAR